MIQRKQTLYLLASLILSFAMFYFKFYQAESMVISASTHILLLPIVALLIVDHIAAIIMFKNRKMQRIICFALLIFLVGYFIAAVLISSQEAVGGIKFNNFGLGVMLPPLCMLLVGFAIRNINKDEALIKSMDRLR